MIWKVVNIPEKVLNLARFGCVSMYTRVAGYRRILACYG